MPCRATVDGRPCRAPETLVNPDNGLCPSHDPEKLPLIRAGGRKGGRARGVNPDDLPPLDSPQAAETWVAALARAVLEGRVSKEKASECRKLLKTWVELRGAGQMQDRLAAFETALAQWQETGDPQPVLDVIEGGASG